MRLVEVELELAQESLPTKVVRLLADAQQRIAMLEDDSRASFPAFVPSDFEMVHHGLAAVQSAHLATGRRLLEWGSGIGVVTCLAVWAGFDAVGIEIEPKLVRHAEELAATHRVATQFACGSFVPRDAKPLIDTLGEVAWLSTGGPEGYDELELEPDDFDVVFAYPWPGEEQVIFDLFLGCAAVGTLLLTYHGQEGLRLQRKVKR